MTCGEEASQTEDEGLDGVRFELAEGLGKGFALSMRFKASSNFKG
jgi:hypothetical protein